MKTTKKLALGLSIALLGSSLAHAQTGLTNITVEKYYVANAADAAQATAESAGPGDALPVGAVTYRFYADMAPNYKLIQVYADNTKSQPLKFNTTGQFYNNAGGLVSPTPGTGKAAIKNNLLALDSYISLGAAATSNFGILKTEDPGGTGVNAINVTSASNPNGVLLNAVSGLTTADGLYNSGSAPIAPSTVGFSQANTDALNDASVSSSSFHLVDGAIYSTSTVQGPFATNRVLIAQITTTNGILTYELNVLVQNTITSAGEYFATNPQAGEFTAPGLSGSLGVPVAPTVTGVTVSAGPYLEPNPITITATATDDVLGSVASVEFFVDGVSVGVDNTPEDGFTNVWASLGGSHAIRAQATDNDGLVSTLSTAVNVTVVGPVPPVVSVSVPSADTTVISPDAIILNAIATDPDGSVVSVEFFSGATSLGFGTLTTANTYTLSTTRPIGVHNITAKATDNNSPTARTTTSAARVVTVIANSAPSVSVSNVTPSPAVQADVVVVTATATDAGLYGGVSTVEFFNGATSLGNGTLSAANTYTVSFTANTLGVNNLTAKATDNRGLFTTSSAAALTVNANNPPTTNITSPANGAAFTGLGVVTVNATAADLGGTVQKIVLLVNGARVDSIATPATSVSFSYTPASFGSKTLRTEVIDNKGAVTLSTAVTVDINDPSAQPYAFATIVEECNITQFCLPLSKVISPAANVLGYDVVLDYDQTRVVPTGLYTKYNDLTVDTADFQIDYAIDAANGIINFSASIKGSALATANFNGMGKLVCFEFNKLPAFGASDTAKFTSTLKESYANSVSTKLVKDGAYITVKDTLMEANLSFWKDNSAIQYDATTPSAHLVTNVYGNDAANATQAGPAVNPDLLGKITYNTNKGLFVNIERDILASTPVNFVINGNDAVSVRRILVNDISPLYIPTVYQAIAADVNRDGVISAGDVTQINFRSVSKYAEFKQAWNYDAAGVKIGADSKDWLFIDTVSLDSAAYQISATYPLSDGTGFSKFSVPVVPFNLDLVASGHTSADACPVVDTASFKGIMLGDVDGSLILGNDPLLRAADDNNKVVIDLANAVNMGSYIDVPVSIVSEKEVVALDFAMKFNEKNLSFESTVKEASNLQSAEYFNPGDRTLRYTSNSLQNYDLTTSPVSIRFNTVDGKIAESDLNSLEGYLNGRAVKVEVLSTIASKNEVNNVSIYPNPANSVLNVLVTGNATVQLLDITGKVVVLQTNAIANQKQELNVENLANGIYLMKVYNDNFVSVSKVVINK
jgi:hypothetical protein